VAIFHLRAKIIGRSQGKSAVASAAYHAAERLYSQHQDIVFDYRQKRGVAFSEIMLPEHAPSWMGEREKLWNAVELFEKRKDATYAREIEVALPIELSFEQQKELLREYITENFVKKGMVADYSIHDVDDGNPHAHIMLTLRNVVENSFGKKVREWNDKRLFEQWREQWAAVTNKHLALGGIDKKISHLSYADQGIDLEPTIHRGYMSRESEEILDRFQISKEIQERNYARLIANPEIALDLLTHHESVFSHHDLARFVNERTNTIDEFNRLKLAIETCSAIVHVGQGEDGKEYFTSKKVLQQERDLIERADRMSKSSIHQLNPKSFDFVLASRTLNEEQKAAFEHILSGNDLTLLVGFAGTGKSYLMDAVRESYESAGYTVVGTALSGRAADGLKQSAKIDSRTIARFMIDWENGRQQLTNKTVLISRWREMKSI
jgi:Ti-type conjugative transfer relaxase TraA